MRNFLYFAGALGCAVIISTAGCSPGQNAAPSTPSNGLGATPTRAQARWLVPAPWAPAGMTPSVRPNHKRSWMSPEAKRVKPLLYSSNTLNNEVDVYAASGKSNNLLGQLTGFDEPYGLCADKSGNVYVTNLMAQNVLEYAHGGTSPIKTLDDTYGEPNGCSVNPKTGDLAVTNFEGGPSGYGSLVVYANASGGGTLYSIGATSLAWPPVYDKDSNLFFETQNDTTGQTYFLELPSEGSTVATISLPASIAIHSPSGTTWDGKYVGVTDEDYKSANTEGLYRVSVAGSTATLVGQADYTDTCYNTYTIVVQPIIYKGNFVGGNFMCFYSNLYHIDYWNYKKGGNPVRYIDGSATTNTSYGQTISK
jgi:hypothetical protein